jgi:hypothetical protein
LEDLRSAVATAGSIRAAEKLLRSQGLEISDRTIRRRLGAATRSEYTVEDVPPAIDVEDLIAERKRKFAKLRKVTDASRVRTVRLRTNEVIGLGFFGDPHLDDDGTNIEKVLGHAELFSGVHPGLYAASLGDITNNWVGRLERLYGEQSTSSAEALALTEHFLKLVQWLFAIHGNHDVWNKQVPLLDYLLQSQTQITAAHEQRVRLVFPNGKELLIHARHKFPGHSQWTKQFGQIKAAMLGGGADIYVGGDKHVSGYSNGWHDGARRMWHAVQVASYKEIDDFPIELGLSPADLFQCPVAIIDPNAAEPLNFIRWEFDPQEGAARLGWERKRAKR